MKHSLKIFSLLTAVTLFFTACDKDKYDKLSFSSDGVAPSLTASTAAIAPASTDADNVVVSYTWTDAKHATDSAHQKYVVEIDTAGGSFKNAIRKTVYGNLKADFTGKEINAILLAYGFPFNIAQNMIIRVTSSYANNNEQYRSNVLTATMTPYRVPPKIPVPPALYIVGDINGWSNNAGLDKKYYFYKTDETTYTGVFNFPSGGGYKLIQELGNWDTQYRMIAGGTAFAGEFKQENADPTFPNPTPAGAYRITVDFQTGKFKAVATEAPRLDAPAELYLVGDINGWNNSGSLDTKYKFTKVGDFVFTLNVDFTGSGGFKLIQQLGNWDTQFRKLSGDAAAGEFDQKNADPTFPVPSVTGTYKVTVNFATNQYTMVKQ